MAGDLLDAPLIKRRTAGESLFVDPLEQRCQAPGAVLNDSRDGNGAAAPETLEGPRVERSEPLELERERTAIDAALWGPGLHDCAADLTAPQRLSHVALEDVPVAIETLERAAEQIAEGRRCGVYDVDRLVFEQRSGIAEHGPGGGTLCQSPGCGE